MWKNSQHTRVKSDNTTAIGYINNMGGIVSNYVQINPDLDLRQKLHKL